MKLGIKFMKPDISIIIPAYNEEKLIGKTIRSIFDSNFSGTFEVIVVCNGCTDKTAEIALASGAKVLQAPSKGTADASNYGAGKSLAGILAFLDADTIVSKNLLSEVMEAIQKGFVGGRTVVRWEGKSLATKIFSLVSYIHVHKWGGFCFLKKSVFEEIGGYKSGAKYGFDFDLARRASKGRKVTLLHRSYVLTSDRRFTKEGWWKHIWLGIKRSVIDDKILRKGVKSEKDIIYEDHR